MAGETHSILETRAEMRTPRECAAHIVVYYNIEEAIQFTLNWLLDNPKISTEMLWYWIEVIEILSERRLK
jgi:hypothetical protein